MPALILQFDTEIAGYVTYGRSRTGGAPYQGELFELYVRPVYQGTGFGHHLFHAARARLARAGCKGLIVWALEDNESACGFYDRLGGQPVRWSEEWFDHTRLKKVAFAWRQERQSS